MERRCIDQATRIRTETFWRRLSRLPVPLQAQQRNHPVQTLRQFGGGRGDPEPHRLSWQQGRHALLSFHLLRDSPRGTADFTLARKRAGAVSDKPSEGARRLFGYLLSAKEKAAAGKRNRQRRGRSPPESTKFCSSGQRLSRCSRPRQAGSVPRSQEDPQLPSRQARTRKTQTRHLPRLLPLRVATRMPPRPSACGRLLRESLDSEITLRAKLSAHLQTPARGAGQLLRRHRME